VEVSAYVAAHQNDLDQGMRVLLFLDACFLH